MESIKNKILFKQVCSKEGEKIFTDWIKTMLIQSQQTINESEEEVNPDPNKYIDRNTLRLLYEILNVKLTHGIDFQSFFDLMQLVSESANLIEADTDIGEDYLHVNVLDLFCKNFIRGFSKLIIDLGFDSFLLDDIDQV